MSLALQNQIIHGDCLEELKKQINSLEIDDTLHSNVEMKEK